MHNALAALLVGLSITTSIIGCAKKVAPPPLAAAPPTAVEAPPPTPPPPPELAAGDAPSLGIATLTDEDVFARKTVAQLNAEAPLSDVLFEVDRADLREDARVVLQRHAEWLSRWPSTRITVEGHCDERGTPEYNLALGERRAAAVQSYLTDIGVGPDRMLVVSKGRETPLCLEQSEECWQRNRRGHFIITGK